MAQPLNETGMVAARALAILAIATALTMALLPHPPLLPGNPSDKLVHAGTFVVLAMLIAQGWPRVGFWTVLLLLSAFGAGIEVAQGTSIIGRDASAWDWLADMAGTLAVLSPLWLARRLWAREPQ